jgi:phosphoadenosine phosphosulfate reductase
MQAMTGAKSDYFAHTNRVIKRIREATDSVIVFYSGGKDSIVSLDLCAKKFKRVVAVKLYFFKDMESQRYLLDWPREKYGIELLQYPMPNLDSIQKYSPFRYPQRCEESVDMSLADIENKARFDTGIDWLCRGERAADSFERRFVHGRLELKAINRHTKRFFPITSWNKQNVLDYMRVHRLIQPLTISNVSFDFSLHCTDVKTIREKFPRDYARIKERFPLIEGMHYHEKFYGGKDANSGK